jgi:hypothetical protein
MTENNSLADLPDPGDVPVLDWLPVEAIGIEPLYQRPIDANRVDAIVKQFSWRSFGALVVVPHADGRYNVTDGQHRLEAARLHQQAAHYSSSMSSEVTRAVRERMERVQRKEMPGSSGEMKTATD